MTDIKWPYAFNEAESIVWVRDANRDTKYHCPDCEGEMIPVMGDGTAHHFRHHSKNNCASKGGEGPRHYFAKQTLAGVLRNQRCLDNEEWVVNVESKFDEYKVDVCATLVTYGDYDWEDYYFYEIKDSHAISDKKRKYLENKGEVCEVDISDLSDEEVYDAINLTSLFVSKYKQDWIQFVGGSLHKHNNRWGVKINDFGKVDRDDVKEGDYCVIYIKKSDSIRVVRLGKRILHNRNYSFYHYDENDRTDLGKWWYRK